jgi:hypothetical protein
LAFRKGLALLASTPTDAAGRHGKKRSAVGAAAAADDGDDGDWASMDGDWEREKGWGAPEEAGAPPPPDEPGTPISTTMEAPSKKAKGGGRSKGPAGGGGGGVAAQMTAPWAVAKKKDTGLVPRKLAYDLSELPPAGLCYLSVCVILLSLSFLLVLGISRRISLRWPPLVSFLVRRLLHFVSPLTCFANDEFATSSRRERWRRRRRREFNRKILRGTLGSPSPI